MTKVERPWIASYPAGTPADIDLGDGATLVSIFEASAARFAARPAFSCMGRTLNYGELERMSAEFAAWLTSDLGLARGTRVAIMLPNLLQYPVALFGILRAGMTVVNVNPLYTARELKHQLEDSGAEAILILENFAATLEKVIGETPVKHVVVTAVGDLLPAPKRQVVNFVIRRVKKMVPAYRLPGHLRLSEALERGRRHGFEPVVVNQEDLAFLQYTGGTTGVSKGAMLTHRNMVANLRQMHAWIGGLVDEGREVVITALPLYHVFSLVCNCLLFMSVGGVNVLITNPRDIPAFVKELSRLPFTIITGVNTLFNALVHDPGFRSLDFSHLKWAGAGGMALQAATAQRWHEITGKTVQEGYGLTETSPVVTMQPTSSDEVFSGTIGLPLPSTEVAIRNDDGQDVAPGEPGELCVRGPQVMKGYWQRPEATEQVMYPDGFLRTGDIATMDAQGFFRIVDRKKDMILVSGFNVFPNEVENVVALHPEVIEAACIGVADPKSTEAVKIFVVRQEGSSLDAAGVIAWCRESLTAYKVPKHVEFRAELPKTNVGKILRRALRDEAAGG
ncbi:AMP-binding protein [Wenzhouxiangella sp. XN24]|uniref:AMP-binding protein n=1 Tax=Wenzhouxiangella sp. XN24 TaxID=2713569 RepID=UPI00197ED1CD|nr:AMP-binding protein [Wenzhouxiangella sp. XN24]